ncbi:fibronectin type III domain-containing protein [candidate division FCPU426 bacterium]|nr:fibronectin type III domain-containing protein [candidate division FCPU426 bacterium]
MAVSIPRTLWMTIAGAYALMPCCQFSSTAQAAVSQLSLGKATSQSAEVKWSKAAEADRYELSLGTDANASNRGTIFSSETSHQYDNLMPGTVFRAKIRVITGGKADAWGPVLEFSTVIPVVTEVAAGNILDSSAQIFWPNRYHDLPYIRYELSLGTDQDAVSLGQVTTQKNEYFFRDLTPDTTYYAKLRIVNPLVSSNWSPPLAFTTLPYSPGTAPAGLQLKPLRPSRVQVQWQSVAEANGYELAYDTDLLLRNRNSVSTSQTQLTVNLMPNTQYYFKVRSVFNGRPSYWSAGETCLTYPAKPESLLITGNTVNQIMVSWQAPNPSLRLQAYEIKWSPHSLGGEKGNTYTALSNFTLASLSPGQTYAVSVRTVNETGLSDWSAPLSVKTMPTFGSVLELVRVTTSTAVLKWTPYPDAKSYELSYGSDIEAHNKNALETTSTSLELKDLIPGLLYYAKVRPLLRDYTIGSWSEIKSFTTYAMPSGLSKPLLENVAAARVELSWDPVPDATEYEIMFSTDLDNIQGEKRRVSSSPARVSGLRANTTYSLKIRALNKGGAGSWSEDVVFTTALDQAPNRLILDEALPTEAVIRWSAPAGNAPCTYTLRYQPVGQAWVTSTEGSAPTYNLTGLDPATAYKVQVRASNQTGLGPWSQTLSFHTPLPLPETAPPGLRIVKLSDIAADIAWKAMPQADGYRLSMGTDLDASDRGVEDLRDTFFALRGLVPETSYFAKVKAYNSSGDGPWSETLHINTPPSPPISAPAKVAILETTENTISLLWDTNIQVLFYEVSIGTDPRGENMGNPLSSNAPPYVFRGLKSNSTYYVKVRNCSRGGGGPWSSVLKAVTLPE